MQEKGSIEQIYQKKTQLEHVLLRPDTYVGSVEAITSSLWIMDLESQTPRFINKSIDYIPGLYKIFDEILVNAADNFQRDKKMDKIKVTINAKNNQISVWNNGKGIPIQIHKEHGIYVPELIFGHLLTSSNYDDSEKKITGGRNGYGAKLTNIFSTKFIIETGDAKTKKQFKMTWSNNMSSNTAPVIEAYTGEDFTCITFEPDLKRFGVKKIEDNMVALMQKRVYDLAGVVSSKIKVHLNGKKLDVQGFQTYTDLYFSAENKAEKVCEAPKNKSNDRWEVVCSISEGQFQQVSFVNSICTTKGGTHVTYITDQIVDKLMEILKKKHKDLKIKPFQVKGWLWIFVNSLIENPAFDSQTKETLTTKSSNFGSSFEISEKFIKDLLKTNIINQIVLQAKAKEQAKMAKTLTGQKKSRLLGIPKLEDANDAGTKNSEYCTLILTEGDSAKSLAMAGIEIVGRDRYGVFPLKGKLLNVREATPKQSSENQELQYLIKILGLQFAKKYENVKSLRYGSIMIMADQDFDGSHIKGLVINFFHTFWPELIHMNGFIKEFVTPIIKAIKNNDSKSFFTINDHKKWLETVPFEDKPKWKVKYYKGLGTSTNKEAKEYFERIPKHQLFFKYQSAEDDDVIDLAFSKKRADDRKEWLLTYDPENSVDHTQKQLRYVDFFHQEMIQFSYYDNFRSIPSMCDGLKPGQRKILFSCFKRNLRSELKVAQLAGYVAEHSAYHHGENSLNQTIVGMAQNFVGSNNISLLQPIGQFGSRNMGGKDAASTRYIYTNLSKITRKLFVDADDHLYDYIRDDGQTVEPKWYLPVIPTVLVNGAEGIGTGWSTSIPSYNPKEIAEALKRKLESKDETFQELNPWFRGFNGDIVRNDKGVGYNITGKYKKLGEDVIEINELPIGKWTRDFKNFLESKWDGNNEGDMAIEDIKEFHAGENVDFVIKLKPGKLQEIETTQGVEKYFNLTTSISTKNMVLFDHTGKLKKYASTSDIMQDFYDLRLKYYSERKKYLLSQKSRDLELLQNKLRFITEILNNTLQLKNTRKPELIAELQARGYKSFKNLPKVYSKKLGNKDLNPDEPEEEDDQDYNYLLNQPIWSLTHEKVETLTKDVETKEKELAAIKIKSPEQFWVDDLDDFLAVYNEEILGDKTAFKKTFNAGKQNYVSKAAAGKKRKGGKADSMSSSEDSDFEYNKRENSPIQKKVLPRKRPEKEILAIVDEDDEELQENEKEETKKNTTKKMVKKSKGKDDDEESEFEPEEKQEKGVEKKILKKRIKKTKEQEDIVVIDKSKSEVKKEFNTKSTNREVIMDEEETKDGRKEDLIKKEDIKPKGNPLTKPKNPAENKENKFNLDNSILKYLVPKNKLVDNLVNTTNITKDSNEYQTLSLTERLKMRERQGDLKAFEDAYKQESNTPIKSEKEFLTGAKRKASDMSEGEDSLEELVGLVKKVKRDDDDKRTENVIKEEKEVDSEEEVTLKRPMRSAAKNRKILMVESDEEDME